MDKKTITLNELAEPYLENGIIVIPEQGWLGL